MVWPPAHPTGATVGGSGPPSGQIGRDGQIGHVVPFGQFGQKVPVRVEVVPPAVLVTVHVSPEDGWGEPVPLYWA